MLRSPWGWIAFGMLLRLAHVVLLGNHYFFGDTIEYEAAALRILHGMGVDQASPRAPLYPMFMALSFWLGGEGNYFVTRLLKLGPAFALMSWSPVSAAVSAADPERRSPRQASRSRRRSCSWRGSCTRRRCT